VTWKLRTFRADDRVSLVRAIDAVCGESPWMSTSRFVPTPAWRHALDQPDCDQHLMLVAEAGGQVVGWCRLFPNCSPDKAHKAERDEAELGIGLLLSFRGRGVGQEMVELSLLWARESGLAAVYLTTRSRNRRAVGLFARCGFQAVDGQGSGQVLMRCNLETSRSAKHRTAGSE